MVKSVAMLMFPDSQSLDITGPMEVFALASRQALEEQPGRAPLYSLHFIAKHRGLVTMASGMQVLADQACSDIADGLDTLLVSGGMGDALDRVRADADLVAWLSGMAGRVRRIGSICSGALLVAEAGLHIGREATTHWLDVPELRQRYPNIQVVADVIYVRDEMVWTSAGITAGMDLALAMVAADHGLPLALKVAKRMVMVTKRSGGQSQFSQHLAAQSAPDAMAELATWLAANRKRQLDTDKMAEQVHMSPRNFRRRFFAVFGMTPQKYLESLRIEAAKPLLEHTTQELKAVANEAGFVSVESMRRAFSRQLGVLPTDYRARFAPFE
jgi:transcriptional regulator GlxA family with amidase domain